MKIVLVASAAVLALSAAPALAQELTTNDNPSSRMDQTAEPQTTQNAVPKAGEAAKSAAPAKRSTAVPYSATKPESTTSSGDWTDKDKKAHTGAHSSDKAADPATMESTTPK